MTQPRLSQPNSVAAGIPISRAKDGLVRIIRRKLKKIQYRPHLINGCLAGTGLKSSPGDPMHYKFNLVSIPG